MEASEEKVINQSVKEMTNNYTMKQDNPHARGLDINQDWIEEAGPITNEPIRKITICKSPPAPLGEFPECKEVHGYEQIITIRDNDMPEGNRWFLYKHLGQIRPTPEMVREGLPISNPEE